MRKAATYFVTTPIYYVNAEPHIGHLFSSCLADALSRYNRLLLGRPTLLSTGCDEHGEKVEKASILAGFNNVEAFCSTNAAKFRQLFDLAGIDYNGNFVRTSDSEHAHCVSSVWRNLFKNGLLTKDSYEGWYSLADECFVSPEDIVKSSDSSDRFVIRDTGQPVEMCSEINWLFQLKELKQEVRKYLTAGRVVLPDKYSELALHQLSSTPDRLSVSRPTARFSTPGGWGIPVPSDLSQTIYVWFDALCNYLTVAGYPNQLSTWPPTDQIVGKDILRFHAILWPAILIGIGLEPPKRIFCHGHWLSGGRKMSKSLGNVVRPDEQLFEQLTRDGLRYSLLRSGPVSGEDADFQVARALHIVNDELVNCMANLAARATSAKVNRRPLPPVASIDDLHWHASQLNEQQFVDQLLGLTDSISAHWSEMRVHRVADDLVSVWRSANSIWDRWRPWQLAKSDKAESLQNLDSLLTLVFASLRISGLHLTPLCPSLGPNLMQLAGLSDTNDCSIVANALLCPGGLPVLAKTPAHLIDRRILADD